MTTTIPSANRLYAPVLRTLQNMGGIAQKRDVISRIIEEEKYTERQLEVFDKAGRLVIGNRIQWARASLVRLDYIIESRAGEKGWGWWELTEKGRQTKVGKEFNSEIIREYNAWESQTKLPKIDAKDTLAPPEEEVKLEDELLDRLRSLTPTAFEHFCKALLAKMGFRVEVTPQSHDGGFDGQGVLEVNPFVTTSFVYECKRYNNNSPVPVTTINQLLGAMDGIAEKGAIITTSRFTKDAQNRAKNSPIELIDGERLVQLIVKYQVGVKEAPVVDVEFFSGFEQDKEPMKKAKKTRRKPH